MPAINPLPTPPSRNDPANFSDRADAFLAALPAYTSEANALLEDVHTSRDTALQVKNDLLAVGLADVEVNAESAAASAASALASKNAAQAAQDDIHSNWQAKLDSAAASAATATSKADIATVQATNAATSASSASASATSASASVTTASGKADVATAQANAATSAKTAAEAARDATVVGAAPTVYATTTAGLAATTSGKYFSVPSATSSEYLILYLNSSGTAVEVKRYPSAAAISAVTGLIGPLPSPQAASDVYALSITDGQGNASGGVLEDGSLSFQRAHFSHVDAEKIGDTAYVLEPSLGVPFVESLCDTGGNAAYVVLEDGSMAIGSARVGALSAETASIKTIGATDTEVVFGIVGSQNRVHAEVVGITSYGQSNSQTGSAVNVQSYDTLVFNGGAAWPDSGLSVADAHASLMPITTALARPQVEGWTECLKERLLTENGLTTSDISYQLLASVTGVGGYTLDQLAKGTTPYNNIISDVTYGLALANAAGKTYEFAAVSFAHGESENSAVGSSTYRYRVKNLFADLAGDVLAVTGQPNAPIFISWQVNGNPSGFLPVIARLQVDLTDELPNYYLATPSYWLQTRGDNVHLSDVAYTKLSAYYGLVHKRVLIDGLGWQPLKPVGVLRQDKNLLVRFNMPSGGKLVLDTTTISLATNYGFNLYNAAGAAITISSVTVVSPDTVKITAASILPAGGRVDYAINNTTPVGNEFTARGNVRDDAGNTRIYGAGGANYPLHNWSVVFSKGF